MIDIVFQLLIFFIFTLKIVTEEGDFNINMPIGAVDPNSPPPAYQALTVQLRSRPDGHLEQIVLGSNVWTFDATRPQAVFDALGSKITEHARSAGGYTDDLEVEIDADYNLNYQYTMSAVSACRGGRGGRGIEKIKFAAPVRPGT
jgi:biopolymer transport protein ExbD